MQTEYEATFENIDKEEIRERLKMAGAVLVKKETLYKKNTFNFPEGHQIKGGWARVRDEGDKITMGLKIVPTGDIAIDEQKEISFDVDNFDKATEFLTLLGCKEKSYQESKREMWKIGSVEICLDEWPYLEPFCEVEGQSEQEVKDVSEKLGFDYTKALFCAVGTLYSRKYKVDVNFINNHIPKITFEMANPFSELTKN